MIYILMRVKCFRLDFLSLTIWEIESDLKGWRDGSVCTKLLEHKPDRMSSIGSK